MTNEVPYPLWLVVASFLLNALFLRRLPTKVDNVHRWICGTPENPGIADRLRHLESQLGVDPVERRKGKPPL